MVSLPKAALPCLEISSIAIESEGILTILLPEVWLRTAFQSGTDSPSGLVESK